MITQLHNARLFHTPKIMGNNAQPGSTPLSIGKVLSISSDDIEIVSVLQMPTDLQPGVYNLELEIRPKKDKAGSNFWYKSSHKVGDK